jgi:chromosomal replication initiator protein
MIYSIQHGQTLAFRNKYRNVELLLIDDVQFLAGKESTQEEFFHTFNALRDAHKQIVVTADKPPKNIPMLEERLTSRFNQGLVTDVQQPDLETRIAILRNRCAAEGDGARVPPDVLLLIADRIRNNIRDLEGCLVRLLAVASLVHRDITLELAEEVVHQYVDPEPDHITPERILAAVAERFGVKPEALCGKRRTKTIALPRQVAMYLLRQLTDLSLMEIGRLFGGRDHTTVMYACDKVGRVINEDPAFGDKVNGLVSTLASG